MLLFSTALMQTVSPWIYQKIKAKKIDDIKSVAYISLIIIAVVNLLLIIFAPEAVRIFAPSSYYEAIWVIPPVAMSVYFMYAYDLFAKFAFYYEKTKTIMIASVIGAVLNIILNYIFIKIFGYIAAGYTTLACYIIYSTGHYLLMNIVCKKYCDGIKPYDIKVIMGITIPFLVVGFLLLLTYNHIIIRYGLILLIIVVAAVNRKRILEVTKRLMDLRKKD